jgi:hypothetical protein
MGASLLLSKHRCRLGMDIIEGLTSEDDTETVMLGAPEFIN